MTKTPRTDEQLKLEAFMDGFGIVETVEVEFAQQLEAELADARAEIERLKEKIKGCSTCKHYQPNSEMIEVCLKETRCCRTTARCVTPRPK